MSGLLLVHLMAVGAWLGCVACETVLEQSRRDRELRTAVARYHYWIDLCVEIPLFTTVLVTGLLMIDPSRLADGLYLTKIIAGATAVAVNLYSFYPVSRRRRAAIAGDTRAVGHYSRMIDRTVPIGLPAFLIALGIGLHLLGIF